MSTVKATNLQHASATSPNITLGSDGSVAVGGGNISPSIGMRNRIINGDMRIDQRNNGASVANINGYSVDRWASFNVANSFSAQRSTTAPAGFTNSLLFTTTTAATPSAADYRFLGQFIEGFNIADLGWGTANAQPVTLSFWVRSSLTGNFSAALKNSAENRSYPFSFTINAANTFEYKTVTVQGDTTGTWLTDNGIGLRIHFNLGSGSNRLGTANAWAASSLDGVTGTTPLVATNGAAFYITGVQLEKGTVATPYEFRSIGQEEILCKRYFEASADEINGGITGVTGTQVVRVFYKVTKRAAATATLKGSVGGSVGASGVDGFLFYRTNGDPYALAGYTASSEL